MVNLLMNFRQVSEDISRHLQTSLHIFRNRRWKHMNLRNQWVWSICKILWNSGQLRSANFQWITEETSIKNVFARIRLENPCETSLLRHKAKTENCTSTYEYDASTAPLLYSRHRVCKISARRLTIRQKILVCYKKEIINGIVDVASDQLDRVRKRLQNESTVAIFYTVEYELWEVDICMILAISSNG